MMVHLLMVLMILTNMRPNDNNMDYDLGGSFNLQQHLILLMKEYQDIFSYKVNVTPMQVHPMLFTVSTDQ